MADVQLFWGLGGGAESGGRVWGRGQVGQGSGRGGAPALCDHVLLAFIEADLAERHGAHRHVDGGGDEAVDADLVIQTVDFPRRSFTAEETETHTHSQSNTHSQPDSAARCHSNPAASHPSSW